MKEKGTPMKKDKEYLSIDETLYRVLIGIILILLILYRIVKIFPIPIYFFSGPCLIRTIFGIYCPGCGGTRAMKFLFHGEFIKSIYYHPLVAYMVGFIGLFIISHTLKHLTKGRIKGIHYKSIYCYIAIIILILNFIWKNYYFLIKGVSLIP